MFLGSLYNALGPDGILISQVGQAPEMTDPSDTHSRDKNRNTFVETLVKLGIESTFEYTEAHCGFEFPWRFVVSIKAARSQERWFSSEAQVNLEMQKRSTRRKDGGLPYDYFDGATMVSFQHISKASATVFCRRDPVPDGCDGDYGYGYTHGYDPESENVPMLSLTVSKSMVGENAGRGVFALVDIPANSYIGLETQVVPIVFEASTYPLIEMMEDRPLFKDFHSGSLNAFMHGYGYSLKTVSLWTCSLLCGRLSRHSLIHINTGCASPSFQSGVTRITLDSGILTFVNHGCNGTSNISDQSPFTEQSNADPNDPLVLNFIQAMGSGGKDCGYNPALLRDTTRRLIIKHNKPIMKGEELLDNYITFITDVETLVEDLTDLKTQCAGSLGTISEYELSNSKSSQFPEAGK
jgi:hypothetical protein